MPDDMIWTEGMLDWIVLVLVLLGGGFFAVSYVLQVDKPISHHMNFVTLRIPDVSGQ